IWDNLVIAHEKTSQLKESNIGILTLDYELFKMKLGESIKEMFGKFTYIIKDLKPLRKSYPNKGM
ncbi:hypothetical protein J1N35_029144, partial [Gossypium stocksii]